MRAHWFVLRMSCHSWLPCAPEGVAVFGVGALRIHTSRGDGGDPNFLGLPLPFRSNRAELVLRSRGQGGSQGQGTLWVGMFASCHPPRQTCLPATPVSLALLLLHAHGMLIGVPLLALGGTGCHRVAGGRKQNWLGPASAALCPLIRCFRQGGGCSYASPAHSCGAQQGQTSRPSPYSLGPSPVPLRSAQLTSAG